MPLLDDFSNEVVKHVKFKFDRDDIKQELNDHMEDMLDEFMSENIEKETAEKMVIDCMGNPDEIGEELNKEHNPVIGWIWAVSRVIAIILIILSILPVLDVGIMTVLSVFSGYSTDRSKDEIVYEIKPDDKFLIDDTYVKIDEVILYNDNDVEIRYKTWNRPFSRSIIWSFDIGIKCVTDDLNTRYTASSGSSSGGIVSKHVMTIENFNTKAKKLIINYDYNGRKIYSEIPLNGGDGQ